MYFGSAVVIPNKAWIDEVINPYSNFNKKVDEIIKRDLEDIE